MSSYDPQDRALMKPDVPRRKAATTLARARTLAKEAIVAIELAGDAIERSIETKGQDAIKFWETAETKVTEAEQVMREATFETEMTSKCMFDAWFDIPKRRRLK